MADLAAGLSNFHTTGTPDTATAQSNGPAGSDGLAENVNGLYLAVPALQSLLGNALTLKGSVADLVTRLSRAISADGVLPKGTSFPASPLDGQLFYRTDQDTPYIYDSGTGTWKPGFDNILYALLDGTRNFTGDVTIKKTTPSVRLIGTEANAKDYRISETGGTLKTFINTGTESSPVWTEDNFFVPTGAQFAFGGTIAPIGYLLEDGAAVSRTTQARLFAVIGTTYGVGDGSTTFNVPDRRGRTSIGAGTGSGLTNRVQGVKLGEENHAQTLAENGPHVHQETATLSAGGNNPTPATYETSGSGATSTVEIVRSTTGTAATSTALNTQGSGSGTGHNTMQPSEVDLWIIKT